MNLAIEVSGGNQTLTNAVVETGPPLDLNPENIHGYTDSLVAVQPLDVDGKPVQVDAMAFSRIEQPAKDDAQGWSNFHATLKNRKEKIDSPYMIGRVKLHLSGSYFFVIPEQTPDSPPLAPARLFSYGQALVLPLVELSV